VFIHQYLEDNGILEVHALSAIPLTEVQQARLMEKLGAMTGKKIDLICRVDPAVLGGIRLNFNGKQVDGTLQGRLAAMEKMLKNTVL
jgi:F-type H+-transporting ATPase subunit delta